MRGLFKTEGGGGGPFGYPGVRLLTNPFSGLGFVRLLRSGSNAARSQAETQLEAAFLEILRFIVAGVHKTLGFLGILGSAG